MHIFIYCGLSKPPHSFFASYFAAPQMIINHSADLIEAGYPQRAEQLLHKVLLSRPGDRDALNNLALALRAMGRNEEAETRLLEALKSDPNYFPTLINLSDICLNLKRPAAAQHHATKAIQIDAENPIAHKLLGMSLILSFSIIVNLLCADSAWRKTSVSRRLSLAKSSSWSVIFGGVELYTKSYTSSYPQALS